MSNIDVMYNDIKSFGSVGVKKSDLRKKHGDDDFDANMIKLVAQDMICISKKGTFIYCWGKEFYLDFLFSSDIKFKYLYDSITGIQNKLNNYSDSIFKYVEKIDCELAEMKSTFDRVEEKITSLKFGQNQIDSIGQKVSTEEFKNHFDNSMHEKSTSIGWVELSVMKYDICENCNLSSNEFYSLVSDLIETYPENYELSSGGYEGVILRGIIHGFVRRI